jgi:hypothetical protein
MDRFLFIFFGTSPDRSEVEAVLASLPSIKAAHFAVVDEHSGRASMWTRDPIGLLPSGRLALDFDEVPPIKRLQQIAEQLGASLYRCEGRMPLAIELSPNERYPGTVQLCCFRCSAGLGEEALVEHWYGEHTTIAIDTQNTEGYRQNRVLEHWGHQLDGIVEEYFPIECADSLTDFFADGDKPEAMMANIEKLTASSEKILDLDQSSVIHLTETRLV